MPPDEAEAHCKELGATSALPKIIKTGFTTLNLIYFFTAGPDEVGPSASSVPLAAPACMSICGECASLYCFPSLLGLVRPASTRSSASPSLNRRRSTRA